MISYRITSRSGSQSSEQSTVFSPRQVQTFNRSKKRALKQYRPGRVFKLNNTSRTGEVLEVIKDINLINWEGDTPFFIRIKMHDNGAEYLTNPSMIRGQ